jgi:hypothetical protein
MTKVLLLECPSPPPLPIMLIQKKMWNDIKYETIFIISLHHYNKTCQTIDNSKSKLCAITVQCTLTYGP